MTERLAVSWIGLSALPARQRVVPLSLAFRATSARAIPVNASIGAGVRLAVSWIGVIGQEAPVAPAYERTIPLYAVIGEPIRPIPPVIVEGVLGPSRPARLVPKRQRLYAEVRVRGLRGEVVARAGVVQPVRARAKVEGFLGETTGYALAIQPSLALIAATAFVGRVETRTHVVQPSAGRLVARSSPATLRAAGHVVSPVAVQPALNGQTGRPTVRLHAAAPPRWEREELWILGLADVEILEEDARELVPI